MKFYIGMTDDKWYSYLADIAPDELNFWQPNNTNAFRAIAPGDMFLFKLHSPNNFITGGGWLIRHTRIPLSLAWEAFGVKNGVASYEAFCKSIWRYRKTNPKEDPDPVIGCILLTTPFFFDRTDWIPIPSDWSANIVQGKTYHSEIGEGLKVFEQIMDRLAMRPSTGNVPLGVSDRFGTPYMVEPRLGQGGFRILVTDAYQRRCAVTGEKTLPVLNASHIKPYAQNGPHDVRNGILLRQDVHTLFDRGYLTVTDRHVIEVSKRIKEEFGNGKEYYAYHGKPQAILPEKQANQPADDFLIWHNEHV